MPRVFRKYERAEEQTWRRPILAVSSGGGHWVERLRLQQAWKEREVVYASVDPRLKGEVFPARYFVVRDGNLHTKLALVGVFFSALVLVLRVRPAAVVSTGAAPGFFAVMLAKLLGAKTIWIDSIANADSLSISGRMVRPFAGVWLTQWQHLSRESGPRYRGSVL